MPRKPPFYRDPEYIRLRDQYYKLLEETGFKDIEIWEEGKVYSVPYLKRREERSIQLRIWARRSRYFERVSDYLYNGLFSSDREKEIWEQHAEQKTWREIAEDREKKGLPKLSRDQIEYTILQVRARMEAEEKAIPEDLHLSPNQIELLEVITSEQNRLYPHSTTTNVFDDTDPNRMLFTPEEEK